LELLIRRVFGCSSEKLKANQVDLISRPENELGNVDAFSLEETDPAQTKSQARYRCRNDGGEAAVVEEIIQSEGSAERAGGVTI
jgi:hypothetical protein